MHWPFLLYAGLALVTVLGMLVISFFLGECHRQRGTSEPYESGIEPTGEANYHLTVRFYLVALFFLILDVESIFIFAWAVGFRELGWTGYIAIAVFIGVLLAMLAYLWRTGSLDFAATDSMKQKNHT